MSAQTFSSTLGAPRLPSLASRVHTAPGGRLLPRRPVSDLGSPGLARTVEGQPFCLRAYRWPGVGRPGYEFQRGLEVQRVDHNLGTVLAFAAAVSEPNAEWAEVYVEPGWPAPAYWAGPYLRVYAIAQRGRYWVVLRTAAVGGEVLARRTGSGPRLFPFPEGARWAAEDAARARPAHWMPRTEVA
jgi:hypothetical protein